MRAPGPADEAQTWFFRIPVSVQCLSQPTSTNENIMLLFILQCHLVTSRNTLPLFSGKGRHWPILRWKGHHKNEHIISCNGPVVMLSQVREIRAHFSSRGERWVIIIITNIRKWIFCKKWLVDESMSKKNKEGQNWVWSDWSEVAYWVHSHHMIQEIVISISQPLQKSFTHA